MKFGMKSEGDDPHKMRFKTVVDNKYDQSKVFFYNLEIN